VLEQAKVERQLSWHTWVLGVFDDMHLVWPALGATAAVLVCLLASAEVMQATNEQRPDSLAGIIGYLASPGSNVNPARIDGFTEVPRRHESDHWPLASEDAVVGPPLLALFAVGLNLLTVGAAIGRTCLMLSRWFGVSTNPPVPMLNDSENLRIPASRP